MGPERGSQGPQGKVHGMRGKIHETLWRDLKNDPRDLI